MHRKNPTPLQNELAEARQAGIYRLPPGKGPALESAAAALGFACLKVSADGSDDIDAILTALGRDLDFPDWYGVNFDALNDCLTDFSWNEAPGYVMVIDAAEALHNGNPGNFQTLNEVFANAIEAWREQDIPFWVFYTFAAPTSQTTDNELATLPALA